MTTPKRLIFDRADAVLRDADTMEPFACDASLRITGMGDEIARRYNAHDALRALAIVDTPDHPDHDALLEAYHDRMVAREEQPTGHGLRAELLDAARAAIAEGK